MTEWTKRVEVSNDRAHEAAGAIIYTTSTVQQEVTQNDLANLTKKTATAYIAATDTDKIPNGALLNDFVGDYIATKLCPSCDLDKKLILENQLGVSKSQYIHAVGTAATNQLQGFIDGQIEKSGLLAGKGH